MSVPPFPRRSFCAASARPALAMLLSLLLTAALLPVGPASAAPQQPAQDGSPTFGKASVKSDAEFVPGRLLVRFREDSPVLQLNIPEETTTGPAFARDVVLPVTAGDNQRPVDVALQRFGGSELVPGLLLGRVAEGETLAAVEALAARPDVLYAEPDYVYRAAATPNDPHFGQQYALPRIGAPSAWDITTGSQDVVVGIVDTGVDTQHEDLRDNIWTNPGDSTVDGVDNDANGFIDDVNGWDFFTNDRTVFDNANDDDHGTHVAGTIGARGNNGVGVTGVNWQVRLMSIKVLGGPNGGSAGSSILNGLNYAHTMKQRGVNLRVLNNSYGGPGASNAVRNAVQQLANAGILFVAAAGNDSRDNFAFPHFPSSYDLTNVIAVASTNEPDGLSGFSNFGARVVSMGAPGSGILSTTPRNYSSQNTGIFGADGATYSFFGGTSMATPHVSGAAALVVAAKPSITAQELRGVLAYSGDPIASLADKTTTGRRLNVRRAIESALENDSAAPAPAANLQVTSQTGRTLNLSWTAPGDDGTSGTAADYDFFFVNSADGTRTLLPTSFFPAAGGSVQTASVNVPLRNFGGTLELITYDNTGRSSTAGIQVSVPVNAGSDPYTVSQGAGGGLSTGGERLAVDGDDKYFQNFGLPFVFPVFGQTRNVVTVSTNGTIYFIAPNTPAPPVRDNGDADDVPSTIQALRGQLMIAGMWDDIVVESRSGQPGFRADAGIFVVRPSSDRIIFRWQGTEFDNLSEQVNFEVELRQDGTIITRYGSGNTTLFPVVGIGGGEPEPYVVDSHTADRTLTTARKTLTNAPSVIFTPRPTATATFQFSQPNYFVNENGGAATVTITRAGDTATQQAVTFATTTGGTATDGADYQNTGARLVFAPNETSKTFNVLVVNDTLVEADETVHLMLHTPENNSSLGSPPRALLIIRSEDEGGANSVQFGAGALAVGEGEGRVTLTVTRTGDASQPASVSYATNNGTASDQSDYTTALGTLDFAASETSKSFDVLVTDDVFDDEAETFTVTLGGASHTAVGAQGTVTVTITDNDASTQFSPMREQNFSADFFVRQHYIDFFSRTADAPGLAFWTNEITSCGTNAGCIDLKKQHVSGAFFLSIEFHETGFLVYRTNQAAFNTKDNLAFRDFMRDQQRIGRGVVIGTPGADALLEVNKVAFFNEFVSRASFLSQYPLAMSNAQYVAALNANTGNSLTSAQAAALVSGLDNLTESRATVLRKVAENQSFGNLERSRAFVYMQYVGYLRRQPDAAGFNFWLGKLNEFNGDFIASQMVRSFIVSGEYLARFGTP